VEKIVLVTSLYRLRKFRACKDRYERLVERLGPKWGDDDKINLLDILEHNGVSDCLWALRAAEPHPDGDRVMHLMAADFAESVLPIFETYYPKDDRPRKAIQAARDFVNGKITEEELFAASVVARDSILAENLAADSAAKAAAWATIRDAAWFAALEAAWRGVDAAAGAAVDASCATTEDIGIWAAARAAAWDAARDAALCSQAEIIRRYLTR